MTEDELNPVLWGQLGVDVLARYLDGEKYKQQLFINRVIIDGSNIDDVLKRLQAR